MEEIKRMKGRFQNKHKTEAEWVLDVYTDTSKTTLRPDPFIPLAGELIIFDKDDNYETDRFKFGDGKTNVIDLSFASGVDDNAVRAIVEEQLLKGTW